jgi:tetratricopeptide (TPR) repeat protein
LPGLAIGPFCDVDVTGDFLSLDRPSCSSFSGDVQEELAMDFAGCRRIAVVAISLIGWLSSLSMAQQVPSLPGQSNVQRVAPRTLETGNAQPLAPQSDHLQSASDTSSLAPVEAIRFNGLQAGTSKMSEVQQLWGKPTMVAESRGAILHTYLLEPFDRIIVTYDRDLVRGLRIILAEQFPPETVAEQLEVLEISPAQMRDETGTHLGLAYPERGVLMRFAPGKNPPQVAEILLESIDSRRFLLRGEQRLPRDYTACLEDVASVLELSPDMHRALWLRGRALFYAGRLQDALTASREAIELDPKNPEYHLLRSRILAEQDQFEPAIAETKLALNLCDSRPELKAQALCQLGNQVAAGPGRDYQGAIDFHLQAIQLAEPLAADRRQAVRRAAREVLVDAHLGAARDIAWGFWKMKQTVVPSWLKKAEDAAKQAAGVDGAGDDHSLRVCREALAAYVGMNGELDPAEWVQAAVSEGRLLIDKTVDPLHQRQLQWELGLALYDALQVYHIRQEAEHALECGELAVDYLEKGSVGRQVAPTDAWLMGRLYFRLGSIIAVQNHQHQEAVVWFDKATPLIEKPIPPSALGDMGRQGETLVSMGVSYWAVGQHARAIQMTQRGARLMEQAVKDGILESDALSVPYANLATMHRHLGHSQEANTFSQMASRLDDVGRE